MQKTQQYKSALSFPANRAQTNNEKNYKIITKYAIKCMCVCDRRETWLGAFSQMWQRKKNQRKASNEVVAGNIDYDVCV